MKLSVTWLFSLLPGLILAQQPITYKIQGRIKNFIHGERVYFMHVGSVRGYIDSVSVTDGLFTFEGQTTISNEPEENYIESAASLFIDHSGSGINFNKIRVDSFPDMATIYVEPGITNIFIVDSARKAVIIPPKINTGHYTLDSIYTAYFKKNNSSIKEAIKLQLKNAAFISYLEKNRRVYMNEQKADMWQFIKDHPLSPASLYILKHDEENYPDYNKLSRYFEPLSETLKNTTFGRQYAGMLANLQLSTPGAPAPEFTMNDQDDKPVSLSSFRGKYVLIDFWASWCAPCRQENPSVVKAYGEFKNQNFTVLSVSLDKKRSDWIKAIIDDQLSWTQVSDLRFWQNAAAQLYSVKAIPQNFLIDPRGKIIAKNLFGDSLTTCLAKIFGHGAANQ